MPSGDWTVPDWRRTLGRPEASGRLRAEPDDFQVWELPLVEPDDSGSHLWLEVCKRNANTQWVAGQLAAAAGVPVRDVGFAGMKDRRAVTTQWFSIGTQTAANTEWAVWEIPGVSILQARRHRRKLQRGALRGNRFRIGVHDLRGELSGLEERIALVARYGVPNYFGPQRFGRGGANVARAVDWLERGGRIRRSERSIYLSAVRSFLFNSLLDERIRLGNWNRLLDGDVAMLDGTHSTFACCLPDPELERRCAGFDIHPTGPLPGRGGGRGGREAMGAAAAVEASVLGGFTDLVEALKRVGLDAARRSLRMVPAGLAWDGDATALVLEFALPPGAYATSVLRELVMTDEGTISEDG